MGDNYNNAWDTGGTSAEETGYDGGYDDTYGENQGSTDQNQYDSLAGTTATTAWEDTATALANPSTTEATNPTVLTSATWTSTSVSSTTATSTTSPASQSDSNDGNESSSSSSGGGMSTNTKIAIAVPVAIVGAAIIAAIAFFLLRRRRRNGTRNHTRLEPQPVVSARELGTSSSAFLPQPDIQPVPPPPITHRPAPGSDVEIQPPHPSGVGGESAAVGIAVTDRDVNLDWRTSEERAAAAGATAAVGADGRPRSPFAHPHDDDDTLSVVSDFNDREAMMRSRALRDDDMSSVSSFEDEPTTRPSARRGANGAST